MRIRFAAATLVAVALQLSATAAGAWAADVRVPVRPVPSWYTQAFEQRMLAAGANGVQVPLDSLNAECPGIAGRGVSAGGCIVAPFGCTANFVFADRRSKYIGTARHCVKGLGSKLVMQVDTTTLAAVGTVVKVTAGACPSDEDPLDPKPAPGCEPGNDFALVRIDPAVAAKWGVNPALPVVGGPNGVFGGCGSQTVKYYGHGYGVAVAQGKPEVGLATNWLTNGYGWTGVGAPGDSGSGVVLGDGRAAGDLTHTVVDSDYPGSNFAGMRITAILQLVGRRIGLVNANGTTTGSGPASCTTRSSAASQGQGPLSAGSDQSPVGVDLPVVGDDDSPSGVDLPVIGDDDQDGGSDGKHGGDDGDGGLVDRVLHGVGL